MNENVDIFLYSHKKFEPKVSNPVYKIITNCHDEFETDMPVFRDYDGEDNISDKNLMYNEYCGFYWLWKNYPLKDYIGMNHYRRYYEWMDNVPDIEKLFKYYSIILNTPVPLKCPTTGEMMNNETWYGWWHNVQDFKDLEQLYHEKFPEYITGFNRMKKAQYIFNSSLFIMDKKMFLEYCDYVFNVLDEYNKMKGMYTTEDYIKHVEANKEKYLKTKELCGYDLPYYTVEIQSRIVGYIAERVLNTFLMNGKKEEDTIEYNAAQVKWIQTE